MKVKNGKTWHEVYYDVERIAANYRIILLSSLSALDWMEEKEDEEKGKNAITTFYVNANIGIEKIRILEAAGRAINAAYWTDRTR